MAKRHTNWMTAKVWTPTMSSDMAGTPDGVIPLAFCALETKARRDKCIVELKRINDSMTMRSHDIYTDADASRPDVICDSNGQVVLDLCKRCGAGEAELLERECSNVR